MNMFSNKKFWSWVGRVLLVAIPAAISGYTSYAKSKVETTAKATASYETLQKAVVELREDLEGVQKKSEGCESQIAALKEAQSRSVFIRPAPVPTAPMVLSVPDAGTGSDAIGFGTTGILGHGPMRRPPHKKRAELPAKFEDAVEQYEVLKK